METYFVQQLLTVAVCTAKSREFLVQKSDQLTKKYLVSYIFCLIMEVMAMHDISISYLK